MCWTISSRGRARLWASSAAARASPATREMFNPAARVFSSRSLLTVRLMVRLRALVSCRPEDMGFSP